MYMVYVQSMDLNKLGQMLGSGNKDFLVEDAIFFTEKAKVKVGFPWRSHV